MNELLFIIPSLLLLIYLLVQLAQTASLYKYKFAKNMSTEVFPKVSILLAARDEEDNIIACLQGLHNLDYPKDKIEILIGDDQSEDKTADLVIDFIQGKENFKYFKVPSDYSPSRGKARVLAFLANQAEGEFYAITDADITISESWIKGLLPYFENKEIGIVSATTIVGASGVLGGMQSIDWLYFMGLLKSIDNLGLPSTAIGNNMMIKKKAYWDTGGYEKIEFSITEDYKVYEVVTSLGWKCLNIMTPNTLACSKHVDDISVLLNQRKRWLKGAKDLPFFWWVLFTLFTLFYPAVAVLMIANPLAATVLFGLKIIIQAAQIRKICKILNYKMFNSLELFQYEIYLILMTLSTAIYYVLPIKTIWKGREY
jgi:cellulose synthase/poly-beta-1,6-N-acetylglucosamine synthase-like glycosyltransferase